MQNNIRSRSGKKIEQGCRKRKKKKKKKSVNERKPFGRKVEEQPKKRKAERTVGWNAKGRK
jgi:ribosomal protein S8E